MHSRYSNRLPDIDNFEEEVCEDICDSYGFGKFKSYRVIETGYEDFNFILVTESGKYFVKIFSKERKERDCKRIVDLIVRLISEGVHHPKVHLNKSKSHLHKIVIGPDSLSLIVMDCIDGKNFFELKQLPNAKEIKQIARDLAHINSIKVVKEIPYIYDSWAVPNFAKEYEKKVKHLTKEEINTIRPLINEFNKTDIDALPKALVHGDVLKTNVIKDKNETVWIVDFSVANIYPRILEIAVTATHLLFDISSKKNTISNLKLLVEEYEKEIKLTKDEKIVLNDFIKFSYGIEYLNTIYEKRVNRNVSEENSSLYEEAKIGLGWKDLFA